MGAEGRTSTILPLLKTIMPFSITSPLPICITPFVRAMVPVCAGEGCIFSCATTVKENSKTIGKNIFFILIIFCQACLNMEYNYLNLAIVNANKILLIVDRKIIFFYFPPESFVRVNVFFTIIFLPERRRCRRSFLTTFFCTNHFLYQPGSFFYNGFS